MVVSALIDSQANHSFIGKSLVKKFDLPLVLRKKLAITLANGLVFTFEEGFNAVYGVVL